ncbi:MAG: hypothetical protein WC635_05635 [Bacteriovorax sp.]|jgi:hypothetical protein
MSSINGPKYQNLNIALESIYYLHRMGDHQAADALLEESKIIIEESSEHKKLSQLIQQIGKYELNKFDGKEYMDLMPDFKSAVQSSGLNLYLGWMHFLNGYQSKKTEELKAAAKFFQDGSHLHELYEVYYWMDNFRLMPAEEKYITFLRTFPAKNIYSRIKGNKYFKDTLAPVTELQKDQARLYLQDDEDQEFDCWHISSKSISPALYSVIEIDDQNYLDLYSGLINDRGEFIFLFLSELNCLSYLISTQLTGATLNQIAEFLERSEPEIEVLLANIQKMGIKIKKSKDLYFLQWENRPDIIMPRSLKVIGLHEFVKKKSASFTKGQLIDILQLTQFGAETLMKKWALAGLIRPVEKNENESIWKFI